MLFDTQGVKIEAINYSRYLQFPCSKFSFSFCSAACLSVFRLKKKGGKTTHIVKSSVNQNLIIIRAQQSLYSVVNY